MKPLVNLLLLCLIAGCATVSKSSGPAPAETPPETAQEGAPEAPAPEGESAVAETAAEGPESENDLLAGLEEEYTGEREEAKAVRDPLKFWNLIWYHFNDKLYLWVLRPTAIGYGKVVPQPARKGIDNFFENLSMPVPLGSCLLQGRWKDAGIVLARFGLNTTAGGLGFYDFAAKQCDLPEKEEDIDQALGSWGIGTGWYVVWPFFGPSSIRGTAGLIGDRVLTPTTWLPWPWEAALATGAVNTVNRTSLNPDAYKELKGMAVAPYVGLRDAYFQNRKKLVAE